MLQLCFNLNKIRDDVRKHALMIKAGLTNGIHVKISPPINKMCSQEACIASCNAVILSSCYKLVTHNLVTNC